MADKPSVADSDKPQYATIEEIAVAVQKDKDMLKEFGTLGEEKFLEKYLKKAGDADETKGEEPPNGEKATPDAQDEEVVLKISKNRFGGKDPMEAIAELEERAGIARELEDERLTFQQRLQKSEDERLSLAAALEAKKKTESVALPEEINIDDLEGDDIFDAEKQKRLVGSLKSMAKKISAMEKGNLEAKERDALERQNRTQKQSAEEEQDAFDRLRKNNPELFAGKREITAVQSDYVKFMTGLAKIIGHKGQVLDPVTGQFDPAVSQAYAQYHDDKSGVELRKQAEANNVKLPGDFDDFLLYHKLQSVRGENYKKDATGLRPYSWSEALDRYLDEQPKQKQDPKLQMAREKKERELQAIENRKKHARELPASEGANPIDLTQVNERDFANKLSAWKSKGKAEDGDWLRNVMGAMQMPNNEIEATLKR
jgi:hypothetical protein